MSIHISVKCKKCGKKLTTTVDMQTYNYWDDEHFIALSAEPCSECNKNNTKSSAPSWYTRQDKGPQ